MGRRIKINKRRQGPRVLLSVVSLLGLGLFAASNAAARGKISKDLEGVPPSASVDVIVQFNSPPSDGELNAMAQHSAKLKTKYKYIPSGAFNITAGSLDALTADPNVKYLSLDRKVSGSLEFAEPTVGADSAFAQGWNGAGVGVAIIDSGIKWDHTDLKPRVIYSENFVPGESVVDDLYGHGTHVAGIVGGNGLASTGPNYIYTFRGIAPSANLINLRVLDATGQGRDSTVISAIDRAIGLKSTYKIRVVNLSLGRTIQESYTLDPLCQAVERAWNAGLVVVVAAGNNGRDNSMGTSGYASIASPANDPYVITVGAMKDMGTKLRSDDLIASYSSKGPTLLDQIVKPDLVAPGNQIISAFDSNSAIKNSYPNVLVPVSYYKGVSSGNPLLHIVG